MNKASKLVYSTIGPNSCSDCGKALAKCKCDDSKPTTVGDGTIRISRETKGRKGKGVSLIKGLDLPSDDLKKLGSELKKKCGCGGAVKDGVIEVQTDDREKLRALLTDKGYKVKLAGG